MDRFAIETKQREIHSNYPGRGSHHRTFIIVRDTVRGTIVAEADIYDWSDDQIREWADRYIVLYLNGQEARRR